MTNNIFIACCIVACELFVVAQCQAGCHQLFKQHHVVQQVVAVPAIYYFAGQATQDEALLRRAIRAELQLALQQQHAAPNQALVNPPIATASVLSAKCGRCHFGEAAKGIRLDGFIDAATRWRITELLSGHDVPKAMQGVIGGLQPGDHPAILQELMHQRQPASPSPPAPPAPTFVDPASNPQNVTPGIEPNFGGLVPSGSIRVPPAKPPAPPVPAEEPGILR